MKTLLVNVCKEKLHLYEFVKPVGDILKFIGKDFFVRHYLDLCEDDLKKCERVIICGTSLADRNYLENINKFFWLRDFDKPVLGICAGMQILGLIFGGNKEEIKQKTEIGFYFENFSKGFLGLKGKKEVYHLHRNYVVFEEGWEIFSEGDGVQQAVKMKDKQIYGVLFHPEVRNKELVEEFVKNG